MARDLNTVLDALLDGILLIDERGCVEDMNAEACRIFELSEENIRGAALDRLVDPSHALVRLTRRVVETGQPFVEDAVQLERRTGPSLIVDLSVSPLFDAERDRELNGAVMVIRDRTVTDSLREIVNQQEQLASYGLLAAGIAHEVKNPLGGIRGAAELIGRWSEDDRAIRAASLIVGEVDRIAELVEKFMVFARDEELLLAPMNLHQVLDSVIELSRMDSLSEGMLIERVYDPSIPDMRADADRLRQVFLNLVRNAMQAMSPGSGRLRIETRMTLDERLTGQDLTSIPTVQVIFSDNGCGISHEILDRLATPFFTTRKKGTGLGLAVSRHWITQHRGTLNIASPPDGGAAIRVNLPLMIPKDQAQAWPAKRARV